jgi:hypothetical protein
MQAAECLSRYRGESTPGISDSWLVLAGRRVGGQEYGKNGPAPALFLTAPKTHNAIMAPHDVSAHPKPGAPGLAFETWVRSALIRGKK